MRVFIERLRDVAKGNRSGVALLIFVALLCGLLIGTVMPGRWDTDLAVLKIDTSRDLTAAKLGNSDGVRVGDWVLAWEDIGFLRGDVIVEVNRNAVKSFGDLRRELADVHSGHEVVFKVLRQDENRGLLTVFLAGTAPA